jgi:cyclic pyranopterin phosphate synthase
MFCKSFLIGISCSNLEIFGKGPGTPFLHKKGFPGIFPQKGFKMTELTHFDEKGQAHMVNVGEKDVTTREAVARGEVRMQPETLSLILDGRAKKGDVLGVARIAAIMAAKKTPELIPLAHPLPLNSVSVDFFPDRERSVIEIEARVKVTARTGVEMEALTAVACAALTIYDMCKAVDRGMVLSEIRLMEKSGGRSGHFKRKDAKA